VLNSYHGVILISLDRVQNGSKATLTASQSDFRSSPNNGHSQTDPVGPFSASTGSRRSYSQFNVRPCNGAQVPFHLRLTLPNTKTTGPDWHSQNRGRFVVAALLKAVRVSKLIDVKPCVKGLYRNDDVQVLKAAR
jgi:hypothetical protein